LFWENMFVKYSDVKKQPFYFKILNFYAACVSSFDT
jgi:hypothetical protein